MDRRLINQDVFLVQYALLLLLSLQIDPNQKYRLSKKALPLSDLNQMLLPIQRIELRFQQVVQRLALGLLHSHHTLILGLVIT